MYTPDYEELEKVADLVLVNVKHVFSEDEKAQEAQLLAQAVNDKATTENNKKVIVADFGNKIKQFDAAIRVHSGHVANGFTMMDKPASLYRDYATSKRVYIDKQTNEIVKVEDFHASDFQKKIDFEEEESRLREQDIARQQQIEENNQVGGYAEGADINSGLFDPVDNVIVDKKLSIVSDDETTLPDEDDLQQRKE